MFALLVLGVGVLIVAGFKWLDWSVQREWGQQLATLAAAVCAKCGMAFGRDCAVAAQAAYVARCRAIMQADPTTKFNFNGVWAVECPNCGARSHFNSNQRRSYPSAAS